MWAAAGDHTINWRDLGSFSSKKRPLPMRRFEHASITVGDSARRCATRRLFALKVLSSAPLLGDD
jgi:hypothetical protein